MGSNYVLVRDNLASCNGNRSDMPHKRAKRSVREQSRKEKGADLAPGTQALSTEAIPKSVSRVLDAARIRGAWSDKKRKLSEDGEPRRNDKRRKLGSEHDQAKKSVMVKAKVETSSELKIKPGESIQHFNRRVEDDMRPLVKSAMQSSSAVSRNARKAEAKAKNDKSGRKGADKPGNTPATPRQLSASPPPKHADRPKEFRTLSSSAPRRLNDVAQAPPEFTKLARRTASITAPGSGKRVGVVSMAQQLMMEEERSKAIARYRMMKADRRQNGDVGNDRDRDGVND